MRKKLSGMRGRGGTLLSLLCRTAKKRMPLGCLFVLMLASMFCLTGCMENQVDIETVINIDAQGAGTRTMTLSLDENKLTGGFAFSTDQLEATLEKACPGDLTWTKQSESKDYVYQFTLNFTSTEDYEKKVTSIWGKEAKISLKKASGTFASGICYEENFTSENLFTWLTDALIEGGYIKKGTQLFNEGTASVQYGDTTYKASGARADIDSMQDAWASGMDVLTTYHANGTCDRQVRIRFDKDTYEDNKEVLQKRLKARCPEDAEISWEQKDDSWDCLVSGELMNSKELNTFMKTLLSDSDSLVHAEGAKWNSLLCSSTDWNETLDVLPFTKNSAGKLSLGCYVKWDKGVSLSVREKNESDALELKKSEDYADYYTIYKGNTDNCSFTTSFAVTYGISKIEVQDIIQKNGSIARTISLTFSGSPSDDELTKICDALTENAEEQAEITLEEGSIRIASKASCKGQNKIFKKIFGNEAQAQHQVSKKLLEFFHKGSFSITLDFTGFLENDPEDTELDYQVKFRGSERIVEKSVASDLTSASSTMETKKHKLEIVTTGAYLKLSFETKTFNASGFTLLGILLSLILILIVMSLLLKYAGILWDSIKNGSDEFRRAFNSGDEEEEAIPEKNLEEYEHFVEDSALYFGEYGFDPEEQDPYGTEQNQEDWDPSQLVESVTETEIRIEEEEQESDETNQKE